MQIFDFLEATFRQFSEKFKKFLPRFPVSFFDTLLSFGLRLRNISNKKFQPISVITHLWTKNVWVKKVSFSDDVIGA